MTCHHNNKCAKSRTLVAIVYDGTSASSDIGNRFAPTPALAMDQRTVCDVYKVWERGKSPGH